MATARQDYKKVKMEDTMTSDSDEDYLQHPRSKLPRPATIILSMTTLAFGLLALVQSLRPINVCLASGFENGWETEWTPAKSAVELQKVTYTSAFRYNGTSKGYYREYDPSLPQYVGKPAPEIDAAWEELLAGQYLVITEEEALRLENPVLIQGYYLTEVELMHSLHCLNAIRKALNPEYYSIHDSHPLPQELKDIHVEHCLEQLRQNIQCGGDLTPVPLRPYGEVPHISLIGTPQVHTCRNFDMIRTWYTDRGRKYGRLGGGGT